MKKYFFSKEKDNAKISMLKSLQSEWTWKQFIEGCMSKYQMFIKYSNMSLTTKHNEASQRTRKQDAYEYS